MSNEDGENLRIRRIVPTKLKEFAKLQKGSPYRFECWAQDNSGADCLWYVFDSKDGKKILKKKILEIELLNALDQLETTGSFNRRKYEEFCPKSAASGPCGFAVMGRIMEFWGSQRYTAVAKVLSSLSRWVPWC